MYAFCLESILPEGDYSFKSLWNDLEYNDKDDTRTCTPGGLECYGNITVDQSKCLNPCFGIFADITKLDNNEARFGSEVYDRLVEEYEDYKRGWNKGIVYPQKIIGKNVCIY